jgi:hypothetical protein
MTTGASPVSLAKTRVFRVEIRIARTFLKINYGKGIGECAIA